MSNAKGVLLLIVAEVIFSLAQAATQIPAWDSTCCTATPSCDRPISLECVCPGLSQISLGKGSIPSTVKSISISKIHTVSFDQHALFRLTDLVNITIRDASSLEINPDGLKLINNTSLHNLEIKNVTKLILHENAMSGFWKHTIHIQINGILQADLRENSLSFSTDSRGPSLYLKDINALDLSRGALKAAISYMDVKSTALHVCNGNSFGRNVFHLSLNDVEITEVKTECISVSEKLSLESCLLKQVHKQAFYGNINQVIIKNSNIITVDTNAFLINVSTSLQITDTRFEELRPNSLSISANISVKLNNVRIRCLRSQALVGLKVLKGTATDAKPITIQNLSVEEAENGSLAFGKCVNLQMTDLDVRRPWPRICPTEKWTRWLLGIGPNVTFNQPQNVVYHAIRRKRHLCPGVGWLPFPKTDMSPCTVENRPTEPDTRDMIPIVEGVVPKTASTGEKQVRSETEKTKHVTQKVDGHTVGEKPQKKQTTAQAISKSTTVSPKDSHAKADEDNTDFDNAGTTHGATDVIVTHQPDGTGDSGPGDDVMATRETPSQSEEDDAGGSHSLMLYCFIGVLLLLSILMAGAIILLARRRKNNGNNDSRMSEQDLYLMKMKSLSQGEDSKHEQPFHNQSRTKPDLIMTGPSMLYSCDRHYGPTMLGRELDKMLPPSDRAESQGMEEHQYEEIKYDQCTLPPHRPVYSESTSSLNRSIMRENHLYHSRP